MTGTILFVAGGDELARDVLARERRIAWADGLPLALEKYGFMGVDRAGPEALSDPETFERYAVVLVSRLPEGAWTAENAQRAMRGSAYVIVEGPPPAPVQEAIGLRDVELRPGPAGVITGLGSAIVDAAVAYGTRPEAQLMPPTDAPLPLPPGNRWQDFPEIGIDEGLAEAWRNARYDLAVAGRGAGEMLATITPHGERSLPAVVRRDRLVVCMFELFALIGHGYTSSPSAPGTVRRYPGGIVRLEAVMLGLIDAAHRWSGAPRARVRSWPGDASWVRTIRHDYDRSLTPEAAREVLRRHAAAGSVATWYWRVEHADDEALQLVARAPEHEIAFHSERLWTADDGDETIARAIGRRLEGVSAHGTAESFRFQGAPNVIWAERRGMRYTEHLDQDHLHPHRMLGVLEDGCLRPWDVLGLPHHRSLDRTTTLDQASVIRRDPARFMAAAGLLQVMNHPDINQDALFRTLMEMPSAGRIDWTAARASRWWDATHSAERLRIERTPEGFAVQAVNDVSGLVVEVLDADGFRSLTEVDVTAGTPTTVVYEPR
jgi:hypothetical protein